MILPKLTQEEADRLQAPLELDLIAYYNLLQDMILEAIDANQDRSLDDIIHEIGKVLS